MDSIFLFCMILGEMIIPNEKFNMTEEILSQYGVRMRLLIKNLASRDFSGYKCISQNSMGNTEGTIHIHGTLSIHFIFFLYKYYLYIYTFTLLLFTEYGDLYCVSNIPYTTFFSLSQPFIFMFIPIFIFLYSTFILFMTCFSLDSFSTPYSFS